MEKSQYNLCLSILRRFQRVGVLENLLLIGSWCVVFYEQYFKPGGFDSTTLRTRDIDFLVPRPSQLMTAVDVPSLLEDLGFVMARNSSGLIQLVHPDLLLEFLVPELGAGQDGLVPLPKLGMNAVALRFLNFLTDEVIRVETEDIVVQVPHPASFALHKLIIAQRRKNKAKAEKDHNMAIDLLRALIKKGDSLKIKKTYDRVPHPWRMKILKGLNSTTEQDIWSVLTSLYPTPRGPK